MNFLTTITKPTLESDEIGVCMVPDGGDDGGESDEAGEVLVQHGNVVWTNHTTVRIKQWQACGGGRWSEKGSFVDSCL